MGTLARSQAVRTASIEWLSKRQKQDSSAADERGAGEADVDAVGGEGGCRVGEPRRRAAQLVEARCRVGTARRGTTRGEPWLRDSCRAAAVGCGRRRNGRRTGRRRRGSGRAVRAGCSSRGSGSGSRRRRSARPCSSRRSWQVPSGRKKWAALCASAMPTGRVMTANAADRNEDGTLHVMLLAVSSSLDVGARDRPYGDCRAPVTRRVPRDCRRGRPGDQLGAGANPELAVDLRQVPLDCLDAEVKRRQRSACWSSRW